MTDDIPTTEERWLPVPGYEGRYEVSDWGRVRSSTSRIRGFYCKIMVQRFDKDGYKRISLRTFKGGISPKTFKIHGLVLEAFVGPCPTGCISNHKDYNRANNRIHNLEYLTPKQNYQHSYSRIFMALSRGEKHPFAKLKCSDIPEIFRLRKEGVSQRNIGLRFSVAAGTIADVIYGKTWKHVNSSSLSK